MEQGKYVKVCLGLLCLLVIFGPFARCLAASPPCGPGGLLDDNRAIWRSLTPAGAKDYWDRPCRDKFCLAATDLSCAFHALLSRDIPNSLGRGNITGYDHDLPGYNSVIRGIGRKHPERVPIYCDILAKIASLDQESPQGVVLVSWHTTELAARLYALGYKSCTKQIMAAFPRNAAMTAIIAQARERCVLNKNPGCAAIRQPRP